MGFKKYLEEELGGNVRDPWDMKENGLTATESAERNIAGLDWLEEMRGKLRTEGASVLSNKNTRMILVQLHGNRISKIITKKRKIYDAHICRVRDREENEIVRNLEGEVSIFPKIYDGVQRRQENHVNRLLK